MIHRDGRKFPVNTLEELRRLAIEAVESGIPQADVARVFGVSRQTVGGWVRTYRSGGAEALRLRRRGRRPGEQLALSVAQQSWVVDTLVNCAPEQVGLDYWLWTRQAVAELIGREFGINLHDSSIRNYLIRWGLVTEGRLLDSVRARHAPVLDGMSPVAARPGSGGHWIRGAQVLWVDRLRANRSAAVSGPSTAHAGTPAAGTVPGLFPAEVPPAVHVLFALSNRGSMYFLVRADPGDGAQLRDFLVRLTGQIANPVNVVAGWRPDRHGDDLRTWTDSNRDTVAIRFSTG